MRFMLILTLLLHLLQLSVEKSFFFNLFSSTEPSHSSRNKDYSIIPRNSIGVSITKTTSTTTTTTTVATTTTTTNPSNIIFESNEDIDFSVCHPENNPDCVLDHVYSCLTSKECDGKGKCKRKTVCGIKYFSKVKE